MQNTVFLILMATGLAALIGLEREMRMQEEGSPTYFGGVRTFAILGALGAISSLISEQFAMIVGFMSFLLITITHAISALKNKKNGLTSDFSGYASFLVGVLVMQNYLVPAVAVTILFTSILAMRQGFHQVAKNFAQEELFAILKFLLIAAVVLPILPNRYVDQWEILNPYHLWLMVIFVASIRFVAFFLSKILGAGKSIILTGIVGGLASSTAVTSTFSEESKRSLTNTSLYFVGILFANMLMFFRVILEVFVIHRAMLNQLLIPLLVMGLLTGGIAFFVLFKNKKNVNIKKEPLISQPFALMEALKFGAFFLFVLIAAKLVPQFLGEIGLYTTAAFSGLADTDAITLSVANLVKNNDVTTRVGVLSILIAVMVNTLVKIGIIGIFGSRKLFRVTATAFILIFAAGLGILFVM